MTVMRIKKCLVLHRLSVAASSYYVTCPENYSIWGPKGPQRYSASFINIQEVRLDFTAQDSLCQAQEQTFCLNLAFFLVCFSCRNVALKGHLRFLHDASLLTGGEQPQSGRLSCCFSNSKELVLGHPHPVPGAVLRVTRPTDNPGVSPCYR